jgi:hypothetical protein
MSSMANDDIGKLIQTNNLIQSGNYTQAQSVNSSVVTNAKMATALKSFNTLYTGNLVNGFKYELSSSQKSVLESLAQQCPYEYGPAVFQARAYLKACGYSLDYKNVCEEMNPASIARMMTPKNNEMEGFSLDVYPNPANDKLNVSATLPAGVSGEIIFYDGIGNKIASEKLAEGANTTEIDVSKIAAGVYYYKAYANHQQFKTNKLIIIK